MQLSNNICRFSLVLFLQFVGSWSNHAAAGVEVDWRQKSFDEFSEALDGYYEERELRNVPAIYDAIVELRRRVSLGGEDAPHAIELLVAFLHAQATHEFIAQQDAGVFPNTDQQLQVVKSYPATREAAAILRSALLRYPESLPVLRAAFTSDLLPDLSDSTTRLNVLRKMVRLGAAEVFSVELASALVEIHEVQEARVVLGKALQAMRLDTLSMGSVLLALPGVFRGQGDGCDKLDADIRSLVETIPSEFQSEGISKNRKVEYVFENEPERISKSGEMNRILSRLRVVVDTSLCGEKR